MKQIIKKFLLILIGIFLSLIILELSLRIAGFAISSYQQYKNNKALQNKSQYTIMCLGESTTQYQYPVQLQKILDEKYPGKFSVIDCGTVAAKLDTLYFFTEKNINKYKPDIAVCMMGINNGFTTHNDQNSNFLTKKFNLKTYKLFTLIYVHLKDLFSKKTTFENENIQKTPEENNINSAIVKFRERDLQTAEKMFLDILKNNENNEDVYFYLTDIYYYNFNDKEKAYEFALKAINKNFQKNRTLFYMLAIKCCIIKKDMKQIGILIKRMINQEPYFVINPDMYRLIENYLTKEEKALLTERFLEQDSFGFLAIKETEEKNYQKAEEYFNIEEDIRLNFPNMETYEQYKSILKKLTDNNIKVICMQYPIRSIKSLQKQLKNESYYDKITFLSNEKNFKDALKTNSYGDLFVDEFAEDFGHCTELGNTMIAENVAKTLEQILYLKQN